MSDLHIVFEKLSLARFRLEHDFHPYQIVDLLRDAHEGLAKALGLDVAPEPIIEETPVIEEAPAVEEAPVVEETPVVDAVVEETTAPDVSTPKKTTKSRTSSVKPE